MASPRASIVVPTHERRASVLRLLAALRAQDVPPERFEVIVAIDGSADGTREAVQAYEAPFAVRALWQPRGGRAAACNAGARLAAGALVIFLDDDMEPCPGFVGAHLAAHGGDEPAGVVGAAPIVAAPAAAPLVAYRAAGFSRKLARLAAKREPLAFTDVYTGNFSIRRDVLLDVGGYDEAFVLYGHEDYELALRLARAGVRFTYDARALAHQHYTKSLRALAANVAAEGETAVLFARKHPDVASTLYLASFASRRWGQRMRLRLLLALDRAWPAFIEHAIAHVEAMERREGPRGSSALFARYDLVFDLLYWRGVERALDARARRGLPFRDVVERIAVTGPARVDQRLPAPETRSSS